MVMSRQHWQGKVSGLTVLIILPLSQSEIEVHRRKLSDSGRVSSLVTGKAVSEMFCQFLCSCILYCHAACKLNELHDVCKAPIMCFQDLLI